jgi:hypothetical protein
MFAGITDDMATSHSGGDRSGNQVIEEGTAFVAQTRVLTVAVKVFPGFPVHRAVERPSPSQAQRVNPIIAWPKDAESIRFELPFSEKHRASLAPILPRPYRSAVVKVKSFETLVEVMSPPHWNKP